MLDSLSDMSSNQASVSEATKQCSMCKEWLSLSDFYRWERGRNGHRPQCKECVKRYNKRYNKNRPPVYVADPDQPENEAAIKKLCPMFGEYKQLSKFHKCRGRKYGVASYCKPCQKDHNAQNFLKQRTQYVPPGTKKCAHCREIKAIGEFCKNRRHYDGLNQECKKCSREKKRSRTYKTSQEFLEEILLAQNGKCPICGSQNGGGRHDVFVVDHDHDNGNVRGMLCNNCNLGLGYFKDDPKILKSAIKYLMNAVGDSE
jgi:Recombination endonuclease VII